MDEVLRVVRRETELAGRLGEPTARWLARYDEANLAILRGRLSEAERLAAEALDSGVESSQPDAFPFYAYQLTSIRYDQGRLADLQPMIAEAAAANPGIGVFRSLLALSYVEAELPSQAAELLAAERLDDLPRDLTWLAAAVLWAFVCASVGDAGRAGPLYDRLAPFASQVVFTGVGAWGTVDHALGRLATLAERHDDAARHLDAAVALYVRMGAPLWLARVTLDEAFLLLSRERPGDRERARELLGQAQHEARRLGGGGIERRASVLLGHERATSLLPTPALRAGGSRNGERADAARRARIDREGDLWAVAHGTREFRVKDSKGMRYLLRLLAAPHAEVHVLELQTGSAGRELAAQSASAGPWLDPEAKRAYRARLEELDGELDEAERFNDSERAAQIRVETEFVRSELTHAVGLGGRNRPAASAAERARVNATRAIRAAIRRIEQCDPPLGRHLDRAVRTGSFCAYDPSPQDEMAWDLADQ
jgi:hypothetical protein